MSALIIGLVGKAGSGKSTAARILSAEMGFSRRPMAYGLKAMLGALGVPSTILDGDIKLKSMPLPVLGGMTFRYAAQTLGTEWGRNYMGQDFWVNTWKASNPAGVDVVADDVRFANEAAALRDLGGIIVRIRRTGAGEVGAAAQHASETEQDAILHDYEIDNSGTVDDLRRTLSLIVDNERARYERIKQHEPA